MKKNYKSIILTLSITLIGYVNVTKAQKTLAAGWSHTIYRCSNGNTVQAWGANASGQLGDGTTTDKNVSTTVNGVSGVRYIAAGYIHSLFLKNDSTVWALGDNTDGQLGDGTNTNTTSPVQVSGLTGIKQISGGEAAYHSLALKANGTVYTWGRNTEGQLGVATPTSINTPTLVPGLTGITAISGGEYHSMALKSDGTVWTWGRNNEGQLGNGSTVNSSTPVAVSSLTGVIAIAGGRYFSIALKSDGTVWTWGQNNYGQLGDGATTNTTSPVQVISLTGVTAIAGSAFHSLAIKNDSTLRSWGRNDYGQLGNGTTVNSSTNVVVSGGLTKIVEIEAGTNYSLAKRADGTLYAWGRNANGQLGDATTTSTNSPIIVPNACPNSTGIEETAMPVYASFYVLPNPSSDGKFQFKYKNAVVSEIEIYNVLGAKISNVSQQEMLNGIIDLSNQANGIYYMLIKSEGRTQCHKLLKQ